MLRCAVRRIIPAVQQARPVVGVVQRCMSSKPTLTDEAFDAKWEEYFNRPDLDGWELRRGLNELYGIDMVPEPKIVNAMFHACRRLDDYPMTLRVLETIKFKSAGQNELYEFILTECRPVMEELGIVTPEEIGLAD